MVSKNPVSSPRSARGGSLAKVTMAALLALVFAALMATSASAAPKYSLSITNAEGGAGVLKPLGLTTDSAGNLYVVNSLPNKVNSQVEKFSSSGAYLGKFGPFTGEGTDVAVDSSGNVWVTNYMASRILEYSSTGTLLRNLLKGEAPIGLTTDSTGNVWWLSKTFAWQMDSTGKEIAVLGSPAQPFNTAVDIDSDAAGQFWVGSASTTPSWNRAYHFTSFKLASWWTLPNGAAGVAGDGSGNVWIGEPAACRVTKYGGTGTSLESFGECGAGAGKLGSMTKERPGLAKGPGGVIWVSNGTEVQKWS